MAGACPVSTLTGLTQSTGPTGPTGSGTGGGPRPATSAAGAGATPATKTAAAPRRSWPESRYGARGGAGLGPFERARSAASRGGRGFAGLGRNRRRRAAEAAARTGARRKRGYCGLSSKRRGWGASTRGGECNGLEPVTKRSPEPCRRRAPRRGVRARVGKQLGGARERKDRGGGGEAHGEAVGGRQRARGGSRRRNGAAIDGGRRLKTSSLRSVQWLQAPTERRR